MVDERIQASLLSSGAGHTGQWLMNGSEHRYYLAELGTRDNGCDQKLLPVTLSLNIVSKLHFDSKGANSFSVLQSP